MPFKVTVVIDNCVPTHSGLPFLAEHGLAMLVETGKSRLLLDTGQTAAILNNLSLLGVAPDSIDAIALSHGHYDHTGGLFYLLKHAAKRTPVFAHEDAFAEHCSLARGQRRFIGIPYRKEQLTSLGADWKTIRHPQEIFPQIWISGSVPRQTDFETGDAKLVVHNAAEHCDCQDELDDDMALFIDSGKGLVVVSGCTHAGLVNMIEYGLKVTGCRQLHGWIGGTHLGPLTREQQEQTIARLQAFQPEFVAANHCTGFPMMARLQQVFGERFIPAFVGTSIQF